ncbi:putative ribonuclease H-like domain-containing protein [Tanacetum coccineum]
MDQEKEANSFNIVSTLVNNASASRTFSPIRPSSGPSFVPFSGSFPIDVANLPHDPLMLELEDTAEIESTGIFGNVYDDHDLETLNAPYADQSVGAEADFNNMESSTVVSPIPTTRVHSTHPKAQIIGDPKSTVQTRGMAKKNSGEHAMISYIQKQRRKNYKDFQNCLFACFLSQMEPKKLVQALKDPSWVEAMQDELLQFKLLKDERGTVVKNKARLVAQGHTQEECIDYDEVFAPVARIEAIRLFLAYASFKDFVVYQMDVKSAFLYGKIEEEVFKQKDDGIFISQDKYVADILKKSMIGSLMYLTTSRHDIVFAVFTCARFQVTPKVSHLHVVKKIFRYLKGQPKLGLWYPRDSPFYLEAFSDSDYTEASLDRKSTT